MVSLEYILSSLDTFKHELHYTSDTVWFRVHKTVTARKSQTNT